MQTRNPMVIHCVRHMDRAPVHLAEVADPEGYGFEVRQGVGGS